ncbi:glycosyltransferase [Algoriphagus boritolerans]|uniref:glycosyltransferase n=1 Tax=Algoriphagus boritolerans TaxID=308111 RepID=UPI000A8D585B
MELVENSRVIKTTERLKRIFRFLDSMIKKILAIVVTYNGSTWIYNCLKFISNSSLLIDVLSIDNLSSDNTINKIKLEFPEIVLIQNKINLGFGQANNIGLKYALDNDYDYVFLLNQDTFIKEDTIENLIKVSETHTDFGILSPIHLNGDGTKIDLNFSNYISEMHCKGLISDILLESSKKEVYELPFVNAAAWLLPISTLKKDWRV